jgi:general secretion pathway protein D
MANFAPTFAPVRTVLNRAAVFPLFCLFLLLSGCAELARDNGDARRIQESENDTIRNRILTVPMSQAEARKAPGEDEKAADAAPGDKTGEARKGGVSYFSGRQPLYKKGSGARSDVELDSDGAITFNFVDTAVSEVIRTILGDLLGVTYIIDANVQGTITAQSKKGLTKEAVIAVLSNILSAKGAALTYENGIYRILPADKARQGALPPRLSYEMDDYDPAYSIQVVPLKHVAAAEMAKVMQSLAPPEAVLNVDTARNLLVFGGNGGEISKMLEIVAMFDVDWLAGTTFAIYQLEVADAATVVEELEPIFGDGADTPVAGLVRFMPVVRLNSVIAMSPRAKVLKDAMAWIRRLDREAASSERTLHVYYVQNGRAPDLAQILQQIFDASAPRGRESVAPGQTPARIASASTGASSRSGRAASQRQATPAAEDPQSRDAAAEPRRSREDPQTRRERSTSNRGATTGRQPQQRRGRGDTDSEQIRIIADEANNALVIMATEIEYRRIEAALRKLDIEPLQVVIEATIAEVRLSDELRYGVQWFFQQGNFSFSLSQVAAGAAASVFPGFSGVYQGSADTRAVINALSSVTDVNVISSPQLMVLDNQTATLQVGDQVPVATQSAVTTVDPDAPIVNSIEFRDTGVILQVTPRVNAGGLVTIDIVQEVSDVVATTTSGIDSPTIQQRSIESTVAVQSGETVILGGLIRDSQGITKTGVPVLKDIPLLGALFRDTRNDDERTELMVLLTPRVVRTAEDARDIAKDLRRRFRHLAPLPSNESKIVPPKSGKKAKGS